MEEELRARLALLEQACAVFAAEFEPAMARRWVRELGDAPPPTAGDAPRVGFVGGRFRLGERGGDLVRRRSRARLARLLRRALARRWPEAYPLANPEHRAAPTSAGGGPTRDDELWRAVDELRDRLGKLEARPPLRPLPAPTPVALEQLGHDVRGVESDIASLSARIAELNGHLQRVRGSAWWSRALAIIAAGVAACALWLR